MSSLFFLLALAHRGGRELRCAKKPIASPLMLSLYWSFSASLHNQRDCESGGAFSKQSRPLARVRPNLEPLDITMVSNFLPHPLNNRLCGAS
jgi:hypothetical protein